MSAEPTQLETTIAALEAQRAALGDALVDAALAPLKAGLADARAAAAAQAAPVSGGAAPRATAPVRRQVTVLFLDVVDSTAISRRLDVEDVQALLDGMLASATAVVQTHRGRVLQYTGDGLLAAFGADAASEADPERAVRAGLALLAEGRHFAEQVSRRHGVAGFGVRVGVHTGEVLLGGGVNAEGSIRGSAVAIAARMEQTAPPGSLRISQSTWRQVQGLFEVEPQPPLKIKGLDEPILTYLVRGASRRAVRQAARGIEGVAAALVGREAELDRLCGAYRRLIDGQALRALMVVGEAGIGKTRLLDEFGAWRRVQPGRALVLRASAHPLSRERPYGLLRELFASLAAIDDATDAQAAAAAFELAVAPLLLRGEDAEAALADAHWLGQLLGLDFGVSPHLRGALGDPARIRQRGFRAAVQALRGLAAREGAPLLLWLDDLHWADEGSLDFLAHLAEVGGELPLLLIGLTRPELFERRAQPLGSGRPGERIDLGPLTADERRRLAGALLTPVHDAPPGLAQMLVERGAGNPYYTEELVKMLFDQGTLRADAGHWRLVGERWRSELIPPSLTGVLQTRLDGLPHAERLTLQQASVIGQVFTEPLLAALDPMAPVALPALLRRGLVRRRDTASAPAAGYEFQHQLLVQAAYDTLLKRERQHLHGRAADWLEQHDGEGERQAETAEHFERAARPDAARAAHARAAEQARTRHLHEDALRHVDRALALLAQAPERSLEPLEWRLRDVRERTLDLQGRRDEQRAELDALARLADALDDDARRAVVAWRRSHFAHRTVDHAACGAQAVRAIELATRIGDDALRLNAQRMLAMAHVGQGEAGTARALAQQAMAEAQDKGLALIEARLLNLLALIASGEDDAVATLQCNRRELVLLRTLGDQANEAIALANAALSTLGLGALDEAADYVDAGTRLAAAVGNRAAEMVLAFLRSRAALYRGDAAAALENGRSTCALASAMQARDWEALGLISVGDAELALGSPSRAAAEFEQAETRAATLAHSYRHDAVCGRLRAALAADDLDAARALLPRLLEVAADELFAQGTERPRLILLSCHQALQRLGDPRAGEVLERTHRELMARAAAVGDETLRASFLQRIPEHAAICAAWATDPGPTAAAPAG